MNCKTEKDHLWDYRWNGEYRRCRRKGCKASEWNIYGGDYRPGIPCGIANFHELSDRAIAGDNDGKPWVPNIPKEYRL
jgi:hypothetical protein